MVFFGGVLLLAGLFLLAEYLALPKRSAWFIPGWRMLVVNGGLTLLLAVFFLLLSQRPWFSLLASLALLILFVVVNNAKYTTLREPLVASDVALYSQVLRFPRLYLPFLGLPRLLLLLIGLPVLVGWLLWVETPVAVTSGWLIVVLVIALGIIVKASLDLPLTTNIARDKEQFGLFACLTGYWLQAKLPGSRESLGKTLSTPLHPDSAASAEKPDLLAIQSESFFDARRMDPRIPSSLYASFDQLCRESLEAGRLSVPAWGANTMRTEFAFLSGIEASELGFYQYYPYWYLRQEQPQTIARFFRDQGYRTVCVHPYPKAFFKRDEVYDRFGFDEFLDIECFGENDKAGPYTSDRALVKKIISLIEESSQPIFVFCITMENHGPLHLEDITDQEKAELLEAGSAAVNDELAIYLRHIRNSDKALGQLKNYLERRDRAAMMVFFGDHLPALSEVFEERDFADSSTDYAIWNNRCNGNPGRADSHRDVSELSRVLLGHLQQSPEFAEVKQRAS